MTSSTTCSMEAYLGRVSFCASVGLESFEDADGCGIGGRRSIRSWDCIGKRVCPYGVNLFLDDLAEDFALIGRRWVLYQDFTVW